MEFVFNVSKDIMSGVKLFIKTYLNYHSLK